MAVCTKYYNHAHKYNNYYSLANHLYCMHIIDIINYEYSACIYVYARASYRNLELELEGFMAGQSWAVRLAGN